MHRKTYTLLLALLLTLAVVAAFAAGCGDDGSGGSGGGGGEPVAADMSADDIIAKSEAAMADVNSASFSSELSVSVTGDAAKVKDPQLQQLMQSPMTLSMEGKSSSDPSKADVSMTAAVMGMNLTMGLIADGDKAYVQYDGQWYSVPQDQAKKASEQMSSGADPNAQLSEFGIDMDSWDISWEVVGTEYLGGTQVYHLKGTADADKMAADLAQAANDPKIAKELGGDDMADSLGSGIDEKQLKEMQDALDEVGMEAWIEVDTFYMRKMTGEAMFDMTGQKDAEGIESMSVAGSAELSGFDEPVEVTAPKGAQPLEKLMEQMFGTMSL